MKQLLLWMKFYPKDWNGDQQLRTCSLASRGLWASFLEPMHTADPYGHLLMNGLNPSYDDLAKLASCKVREVKYGIQELLAKGVASQTDTGVLFSRRMVRDAERRDKRQADGAKGGHPLLMRGKPEVNHEVNQRLAPIASGVLASAESLVFEKNEERLDEAWPRFLLEYPQHRVQRGRIVQDGFIAACQEVGIGGVFARLDAHKRSVEWKKGLVPSMTTYFGDRQAWRQELPEQEPAAQGRHQQWIGRNKDAEIADL